VSLHGICGSRVHGSHDGDQSLPVDLRELVYDSYGSFCFCYALNQVGVRSRSRSGGVCQIGLGFSLCAVPLRYYMSEYFGVS
jgi:hypothetical protein